MPFSVLFLPRLVLRSEVSVSPGNRLEMRIVSPPKAYHVGLYILLDSMFFTWWFLSKKLWPGTVVLHLE